jgi:predicted RNase H-like nuclease
MVLPGRVYAPKPFAAAAVDVSGSMTARPEKMESALGAFEEMLGEFEVSLVCVDQDVFVPERTRDTFARGAVRGRCLYQKATGAGYGAEAGAPPEEDASGFRPPFGQVAAIGRK